MWKAYELPTSCYIDGKLCNFNADWRKIIDIIICLNDNELIETERVDCALRMFFKDFQKIDDVRQALNYLWSFISGGEFQNAENKSNSNEALTLMSWEKDLPIIIPAVNKSLGYDVRGKKFLHWWTFLGGYKEIGDCTFSTFVAIRKKILTGKKLESWEKELYKNHADEIKIWKNNKSQEDENTDDILVQRRLMEKR